jgi:SOS-response transcriptional repressor LexA
MPHSLSERQKEVLDFIKNYIRINECSPRLEEIAAHFEIKSPTVHKILESLQSKGFLYFSRDKVSGFYIRLIEGAGTEEKFIEIAITGRIDLHGEVYDFPRELGHFAAVLVGSNPEDVFALFTSANISQANISNQDILIFDIGKKPQPGDICLTYIGERLFLVRIASKTYDENLFSLVTAQPYPVPSELEDPQIRRKLNWTPLAYDEGTHDYFLQVAEDQKWVIQPISPDLVLATALRLVRQLAF